MHKWNNNKVVFLSLSFPLPQKQLKTKNPTPASSNMQPSLGTNVQGEAQETGFCSLNNFKNNAVMKGQTDQVLAQEAV